MSSVNKVILIGNLGKDPDLKQTASTPVCKFSLATQDIYGEKKTQWHNIVVFGKQAESCDRYLEKGRKVCVEGSLSYNKYQTDSGETKYFTEILAQNVVFLGNNGAKEQGSGAKHTEVEYVSEDDIPF